ncbi:MAG: formimidoylglutamase [Bacteroidales bacterium]|nr:formimidoylglutamase [Bacteroidales bacterium]
MMIKNYTPTSSHFWTGRIDDTEDREAFRMHQLIQLIDLNQIQNYKFDLSKINIFFLGFKSDIGVQRNLGRAGAEFGPEYIRKELANLPVNFEISTELFDAGDVFCADSNLENAQAELRKAVNIILTNGLFPLVLGGGHALSLGHYLGINDFIAQTKTPNIGIINFDAHWDLRPYESEGSSGTMFSQIADFCEEKEYPFNYLCLGLQTSGNTRRLFKRATELGAKHILAKDFKVENAPDIKSQINNFINNSEHIYLTLCSDVFNSASAPGVSAMQPFGMNPEVVLSYIKKIIRSNKLIGFDIAEVSPRFDQDNQTAKLAAVIIYAIINELSEYN